jgi:hypothetical protein
MPITIRFEYNNQSNYKFCAINGHLGLLKLLGDAL